MFYLVLLYCGVMAKVCTPLNAPGQPFPTYEDCRQSGIANIKANPENIKEFTCLVR